MSEIETTGAAAPAHDVIGRRAVLCCAGAAAAAGAVALAGCGSSGGDEPDSAGLKGKELAAATAVPVGGGSVNKDLKVVVTQPAQGTYKAFTAVCPHQGCLVDKIENGVIECPCHGSHFTATDGSVVRGPANKGLAAYPVRVEGGRIVGA
ncbi:Rieske (2Fe-2S) protein [Actinomadura parmotrematis]|uniref:Cytochrome bc1 complex Rieske iron-sulfur subunit n=1 Tax=Actinomadura parmotrematis TaxID=2864039 RepID=A0ABS7FS38_9ACTN|nr:Rieske (2Fe-2S) protein [Actinomadura parmotrematis]MBW8483208.1 Rieske (2Fe-2S) protein [Actinomadura parmotrematis]